MEDLTGRVFGDYTSLGEVKITGKLKSDYYEKCRCICGEEKFIYRSKLKNNPKCTRGKWHGEESHGFLIGKGQDENKRFYTIWAMMKQRCHNPKQPAYKRYGARGIKVCERWHKFSNFFDDMYPSYASHVSAHGEKDTSIDRIDNGLGYNPENCRWATTMEQMNNKTNNVFITYKNVKYTKAEFLRFYKGKTNIAASGKDDIEKDINEFLYNDKTKVVKLERSKLIEELKTACKDFDTFQRYEKILSLVEDGFSLADIAKVFGVSRQRIDQILYH